MENKKKKQAVKFQMETDPIMHIIALTSAFTTSYFLAPQNLSSVPVIACLVGTTFLMVNLFSHLARVMGINK